MFGALAFLEVIDLVVRLLLQLGDLVSEMFTLRVGRVCGFGGMTIMRFGAAMQPAR